MKTNLFLSIILAGTLAGSTINAIPSFKTVKKNSIKRAKVAWRTFEFGMGVALFYTMLTKNPKTKKYPKKRHLAIYMAFGSGFLIDGATGLEKEIHVSKHMKKWYKKFLRKIS